MTAPTNFALDLECEDAIRDPAAYFDTARANGGAVQWSEAQHGWAAISHAEIEAAFRDDQRLSADRSASFQRRMAGRSESLQRAGEMLTRWMNFRDEPTHSRLRAPAKGAFTPRRVGALESHIQSIVDEVIDSWESSEVDLTRDFAKPVPALVIAAIMGVDPADRERFQDWSHDLAKLVFSAQPGEVPDESVGTASDEFIAYFRELIARERKHPRGTLLSTIVNETGTELDEFELIATCTMLLFAGHETTLTLVANALGMMLERPELLEQMRTNRDLDATAPDEFLRTVGPARARVRKVAVDHERGGQLLRKGETVYMCIAAANHDPAEFHNPGEIDLARDPNPHFGFGWGPHFCIGANLARLEARTAIRTLLDRFPLIETVAEIPELRASTMGFGRRPLLVRLG